MIIQDRFEGGKVAFEGDRTLLLRSLPAGAQVSRAVVKLEPANRPLFEEEISFVNGQGDWGATKTRASGFVEIDFHARRTLRRVTVANLLNARLQVDIGGLYVEINEFGAMITPESSDPYVVPPSGELPALATNKFKLTQETGNPDISRVTIQSAPSNLTLRLGELPPFWARPGEFVRPETTPEFSAMLAAFLPEAEVENGFYLIPLTVHSDSIARLDITVEFEYVQQQPVLPETLAEASLPFDWSGLPAGEEAVLRVALPAGAQVLPKLTSARVLGSFDNRLAVFGPSSAFAEAVGVPVTSERPQAQPLIFSTDLTATSCDLQLLACSQTASLAVDLLADADGKPWKQSLLPRPATLEISRPPDGQPDWVNIPFPSEILFRAGVRYWLFVQCLAGEADWQAVPLASVAQAAARGRWIAGQALVESGTGLQFTSDGGLSWRPSSAPGVGSPLAAMLHLRYIPTQFQVPIELEVGEGEAARRVSLDRFQPLGRVDFALDFPEVAEAFNQYLIEAGPVAPPEGEHLKNGDLERWTHQGDRLGSPRAAQVRHRPIALAFSPDGSRLYVGSNEGPGNNIAHLEVWEPACGRLLADLALEPAEPTALALSPDGRRAYVLAGFGMHLVDTTKDEAVGSRINLLRSELISPPRRPAVSRDGRMVFLTEFFNQSTGTGGTFEQAGAVAIYDAQALETDAGQATPASARLGTIQIGNDLEPVALAVAPNGQLWVLSVETDGDQPGWLQRFNPLTRQPVGQPIPAGDRPTAIAITPDGGRVLIANSGSHTLQVVDAGRGATLGMPIVLSHSGPSEEQYSLAVAPDGKQAYIASLAEDVCIPVYLDRSRAGAPVPVESQPLDIAASPTGEGVWIADEVIDEFASTRTMTQIPVGAPLPAEWSLTSGRVWPLCLPEPEGRAAILGDFLQEEGGEPPLQSALSQVLPVTGGARYILSFSGIATDPEAVAEVFWLGAQCGLLQVNRLPLEIIEGLDEGWRQALGELVETGRADDEGLPLVLHRLVMTAPAGASMAEVRFLAPAGQAAAIDTISLAASAEQVNNADLQFQPGGMLSGWVLSPENAPGVTLVADAAGVELRNAGAGSTTLSQRVPLEAGQHFSLAFQGRAEKAAVTGAHPRLEQHWLGQEDVALGSPGVLEIPAEASGAQRLDGAVPDGAVAADLRLVVPAGVSLQIQRISLQNVAMVEVPLSFVARSPGELTVTNVQVAYEIAPTPMPALPPGGPCAATPPGRQPGQGGGKGCYCPSCQAENELVEPQPVETEAGQPAAAGACANCGTALVRIGGQAGEALRRERLQSPLVVRAAPLRASAPAVLRAAAPFAMVPPPAPLAPPAAPAPTFRRTVVLPGLMAVSGIAENRARLLEEAGISSLARLAAAQPAQVAAILPGVSEVIAAGFVQEARRLRNLAFRSALRRPGG